MEVCYNGVAVAHAEATGPPYHAAVEKDAPIRDPGWITARCWGAFRAQSSPVYVTIDGKMGRPDAATVAPFMAQLDKMLEWAAREARCDDHQRQRLAGVFEAARQELLRRGREKTTA